MKAVINNYKRIEHAELELDPKVTILFGNNRAGKSSALEAIGMATSGQSSSPAWRNTRVRVGTNGGDVKVTEGDKSTMWTIPGGQRSGDGWDIKVTPVAAGLVKPGEMKPADFNALLQSVLNTTPTKEDLTKALEPHGYDKAEIDQIWKFIQEGGASGWDTAHESYTSMGKRLKGQWQEVTGAKGTYGKDKAKSWYPDNWEQDLAQASEENLSQQMAFEQTQLEAKIADNAISDHDYGLLQEKFYGIDTAREELALKKDEAAQKAIEAKAASEAYAKLPLPDVIKEPLQKTCAYCEKINYEVNGKMIKIEDHKRPSQAKIDAAAKARIDQQEVCKKLQGELTALEQEVKELEKTVKDAEAAGVKLSHSVIANGADQKEVDAQRELLARATKRLTAFRKWSRALQIHESLERNQILIDALAIGGLRKASLVKAVGVFNERYLKPLAEFSGWPLVVVHDDLTVTQDRVSFEPSSGAERFCINASLQIAFAMAEKSKLILIDGADILFADMRSQFMAVAEALSIYLVIAMSAHNREDCPDLKEVGMGSSYWVEAGKIEPLKG